MIKTTKGITREEFVKMLGQTTLDLTFKKKNGEMRRMKATLNPEIVKSFDETKTYPYAVVPVWDVEKDAWRCLNFNESLTIYNC